MGNRVSAVGDTRTLWLGAAPGAEPCAGNVAFPDNRVVSAKYTVWNFLPKNLFEQFRRIANFYFLCMSVISVCIDSPVSPYTSVLPLVFVILVTTCKQGYEDWLRHRSDREVNRVMVTVVRRGCVQQVMSRHVCVGDLVRVHRDEDVPCDLVLLTSSDPEGRCYLNTANLDGETNLKMLVCPRLLRSCLRPDQVCGLKAQLECEQPTPDLYRFYGRIQVYGVATETSEGVSAALGADNVLLRGTRLKNTDYVYGCAVYTGRETKLALNSRLTRNKFSTVERSINRFLLFFLAILVIEVVTCVSLKYWWEGTKGSELEVYLGRIPAVTADGVLQDLLSFFLLFNYIIPISLYVTIEMQKFLGSMFFEWDAGMYCAATQRTAVANTSDLNEELGQVGVLLSDKTGTLTENCMRFRRCAVGGGVYAERDGVLLALGDDGSEERGAAVDAVPPELEKLLLALALCHSVEPAVSDSNNNSDAAPSVASTSVGQTVYESAAASESLATSRLGADMWASVSQETAESTPSYVSSPSPISTTDMVPPPTLRYHASCPDEKALVEAGARFGVAFLGVQADMISVMVRGRVRRFRRLDVLEFTSERKRMSVVVEDEEGCIWLYCKGADAAVFPIADPKGVATASAHVTDFAMRGLRTMVFGCRQLTTPVFQTLSRTLQASRETLTSRRESLVRASYDTMETGVHVVGVTGVEDRLQDGVPETLQSLRAAGIKVWVLTGDKVETAVNVSVSCGHFGRSTRQLMLTDHTSPETCVATLAAFRERVLGEGGQGYALVMDGGSLALALRYAGSSLAHVAMQCGAVVCCRMSPLQKCEVVRLVKRSPQHPITAAIGDGANDVSMIQEAHVGIGLMGREGRQAVRCSDFAVARFRFLERALLVHGHWYYLRLCGLVHYSFYKNVVFISPQLLYSCCSSQPLYHGLYLTLFNAAFTSLPPLVFGLLEQPRCDAALTARPQLYRELAGNAGMSWGAFLCWLVAGMWHAVVLYYAPFLMVSGNPAVQYDNRTIDGWAFGSMVFHSVMLVVSLKLVLHSRYWTWLFLGSVAVSVCLFLYVGVVYSSMLVGSMDGTMYLVYTKLLMSPSFWLLSMVLATMCLVPDVVLMVLWHHLHRKGIGGGLARCLHTTYNASSGDVSIATSTS